MLIAENLTYAIKQHTLLRGVNFSIRPGEFIGVLGANGAGKSTLLKLLSGEHTPTDGHVSLAGKRLSQYSDPELATRRATMAQQHQLSADFTVKEVVLMGRYPYYGASPRAEDLAAVDEMIRLCGLELLADRSALALSGGEKQRVHLARVLAQLWKQNNALLLLDEPVSAMDIRFQHQTLAIARSLASRGWMVVAVLHDMNLASQYTDRLLLLKNGRKMLDGTPIEVLTTRNIFSIFAIDAQVSINPATLRPIVVPGAINMDAMIPADL